MARGLVHQRLPRRARADGHAAVHIRVVAQPQVDAAVGGDEDPLSRASPVEQGGAEHQGGTGRHAERGTERPSPRQGPRQGEDEQQQRRHCERPQPDAHAARERRPHRGRLTHGEPQRRCAQEGTHRVGQQLTVIEDERPVQCHQHSRDQLHIAATGDAPSHLGGEHSGESPQHGLQEPRPPQAVPAQPVQGAEHHRIQRRLPERPRGEALATCQPLPEGVVIVRVDQRRVEGRAVRGEQVGHAHDERHGQNERP